MQNNVRCEQVSLACQFLFSELKTIKVKDSAYQGTIGQRSGLSPTDIDQVKNLYKCSGTTQGKWGKKIVGHGTKISKFDDAEHLGN